MKLYKTCAAVIVSAACLSAVTAEAVTNTLEVFTFGYGVAATSTHVDPIITVGDTVKWVWKSGVTPHSTTAAGGQLEFWDSGLHTQPFTNTHTFTEVGTFSYYCTAHGTHTDCGMAGGTMFGKIIVTLPGAIPARVTSVTREADDIRVNWVTGGLCKTNALQRATGPADGSYTNNFADIFTLTNTLTLATNYVDVGAGTNFPARYYRVRLVP
jgi:plastocyanin